MLKTVSDADLKPFATRTKFGFWAFGFMEWKKRSRIGAGRSRSYLKVLNAFPVKPYIRPMLFVLPLLAALNKRPDIQPNHNCPARKKPRRSHDRPTLIEFLLPPVLNAGVGLGECGHQSDAPAGKDENAWSEPFEKCVSRGVPHPPTVPPQGLTDARG